MASIAPVTCMSPSLYVELLPQINNLKDLSDDGKECHICSEVYSPDPKREKPKKLPRGHIFGSQCLVTWLSDASADENGNKHTCPMCRKVLFTPLQNAFRVYIGDEKHHTFKYPRILRDPFVQMMRSRNYEVVVDPINGNSVRVIYNASGRELEAVMENLNPDLHRV